MYNDLLAQLTCSAGPQVYVRVGASPRSAGDLAPDSEMEPSTSASPRGAPSQHKYSFNIGSLESFERKMEEAQEALGFDPNEFVPVTYTHQLSWSQEALRLLPTVLLIGGYLWFTRKGMGSGGLGGGGMGGGRGIFNVGKAQVGTIDKNAKDKIMFKVRFTTCTHCTAGALLMARDPGRRVIVCGCLGTRDITYELEQDMI